MLCGMTCLILMLMLFYVLWKSVHADVFRCTWNAADETCSYVPPSAGNTNCSALTQNLEACDLRSDCVSKDGVCVEVEEVEGCVVSGPGQMKACLASFFGPGMLCVCI